MKETYVRIKTTDIQRDAWEREAALRKQTLSEFVCEVIGAFVQKEQDFRVWKNLAAQCDEVDNTE